MADPGGRVLLLPEDFPVMEIREGVEGRTAIVTGGGSGLGEAISKDLADHGASVVVMDVDRIGADRVVADITAAGGDAVPFTADAAVPDDHRRSVEFAQLTFGALHLAVNNAGVRGATSMVGDVDLDDWDRVVSINLSGVMYGMRQQIPAILDSGAGDGAIVNIGSVHSCVAAPGIAAYTAAKHGVIGLTRTAAAEYGPRGLRVNAIGPGYIETPLLESATDEVRRDRLSKHPLGRFGRPEEIAHVATFLLSRRASFMTGSFVVVDGGYTTV